MACIDSPLLYPDPDLDLDMDMDLDMDLDLDLDATWLDAAETCIAEYASFYKKDVTRLTIVRAYIANPGVVVRVSRDEVTLDAPNTLTMRHLCALAAGERVWKKYLCTLTIDEDAVEDFADLIDGEPDGFFRDVTDAVQDIAIERTIEHFHDINTLFMLFKEDAGVSQTREHRLTRKNRGGHEKRTLLFQPAKTRKKH